MAAKPALKSVEPAKGKAAAAPVDAGVAAPKKKGKLPLIVGLLVLVLSASGGAAWYFLHGNPPSTDKHDVVVEKEKKLALYVPLEAFTVNLGPGITTYKWVSLFKWPIGQQTRSSNKCH